MENGFFFLEFGIEFGFFVCLFMSCNLWVKEGDGFQKVDVLSRQVAFEIEGLVDWPRIDGKSLRESWGEDRYFSLFTSATLLFKAALMNLQSGQK